MANSVVQKVVEMDAEKAESSKRCFRCFLSIKVLKTRCFRSYATPCHSRGAGM